MLRSFELISRKVSKYMFQQHTITTRRNQKKSFVTLVFTTRIDVMYYVLSTSSLSDKITLSDITDVIITLSESFENKGFGTKCPLTCVNSFIHFFFDSFLLMYKRDTTSHIPLRQHPFYIL